MRRRISLRAVSRGKLIAVGAAVIAVMVVVGLVTAYVHNDRTAARGSHTSTSGSASAAERAGTSGLGQASPGPSSPGARPSGPVTSGLPSPPSGKNCASRPSACGYPDETNTGWQHTGVKLKQVNTDPYNIDKAGAVVDGLDIRGCVQVRAKNVTIKRSKITCDNQPMIKNFQPDGHGGLIDIGAGLVVEDVEFDGMNNPDAQGVAFNNYTVRRANFHNIGAALKLGSGVRVEDSYVHGIASTNNSHNGGFPSDGGSGITVRHNTVLMNSQNGYAIAIYNQVPAGSVVQNVVIDDNLLAGGNYIIYCGAPGQVAPNLRVTNNRFSNTLYAKGGFYGPTANCDGAAAWTNNYWDADKAALSP